MRFLAAAAVAAAVLVSGCSSPTPPSRDSGGDSGAAGDVHVELPTGGPAPVWDEQAATSAMTAARTAVAAFIRKGLSPIDWWRQLLPLLDDTSQQDYAGTDPANVPGSRLGKQSMVQEDGTPYLAVAAVQTDVGYYTVHLSRQDPDGPWRVVRFELPKVGG